MKITYSYNYHSETRQKDIPLESLLEMMHGVKWRKRTLELQERVKAAKMMGQSAQHISTEGLPMADFSTACNSNVALVLLSFHSENRKRLASLSNIAQSMPQTAMTFIGPTGETLDVVCAVKPLNGDIPTDISLGQKWMDAAFDNTAHFFSQVMEQKPESHEAGTRMLCQLGYDPDAWLNPNPTPVPINVENRTEQVEGIETESSVGKCQSTYTELQLANTHFYYIFNDLSFEPARDEIDYLQTLAKRCSQAGVNQEIAVRNLLTMQPFDKLEALVRSTFEAYYCKHPMGLSGSFTPALAQQYRLGDFLKRRYRFRRNIISGGVEYQEVNRYLLSWRPVTKHVLNSITLKAQSDGIRVWDNDVRRYVESNEIMEYDPIAHYLSELPQWDGRDRLKEMASRVHTDDPQWEANFKTWMRSMVNQWGNRSRLYGSSMVMMLTGAQGTGKSTFIRLLLPPELSSYYLDRLDFTTKKEAERALTQFALINIDEFDQISKSQTAYLKHLLQKSNVVQRKLYEQTYTQSRRFAAFAATTNSPQPLVDITGSRRYMVEEVKGRIDVNTVDDKAIDYPQLYAQIVAEIQAGEPVYFDSSRERAIQQRNELFTIPDTQAEIFTSMFRKPTVEDSQETVSHLSATQIIEQMHQRHKSMKISHASIIRLGVYLSSNQYERKTIRGKVLYSVVAIDNSI